jgi:hypothetical protein
MRDHCRTQHGFDPMPNTFGNYAGIRKDGAYQRFLELMRNHVALEGLGTRRQIDKDLLNSIGEGNNALNYLMDNFVIMEKKEVKGISAYACDKCQLFQYKIIKDMGTELTAEEKHRCVHVDIDKVNQLQNKIARLKQIREQALDCLVKLTNWVWNGEKYLIGDSNLETEYPVKFLQQFHAPRLNFRSITPNHWAWKTISEKKVKLSEIGLKDFIERTGGTYAIIFIQSGTYSGDHLIYVTGSG